MARPQYRTCIQLALGLGLVAGISVLCAAGLVYELTWRAAGWLVGIRRGGDGADLAGAGEEDPLDDQMEDERGQ
jgi:hypothetical protein